MKHPSQFVMESTLPAKTNLNRHHTLRGNCINKDTNDIHKLNRNKKKWGRLGLNPFYSTNSHNLKIQIFIWISLSTSDHF